MSDLGSTVGMVAMAAAAVAVLALLMAIVTAAKLRRVRSAQSAVIGGGEPRDLGAHAHELQLRFHDLAEKVDRFAREFGERAGVTEQRLDGTIAHFAVVRYDAYSEMSGRQSSSIALLDSHRSGVILSSILHREQARLYAKQVVGGRSELDLSPEEQEALGAALSGQDRAKGVPSGGD